MPCAQATFFCCFVKPAVLLEDKFKGATLRFRSLRSSNRTGSAPMQSRLARCYPITHRARWAARTYGTVSCLLQRWDTTALWPDHPPASSVSMIPLRDGESPGGCAAKTTL